LIIEFSKSLNLVSNFKDYVELINNKVCPFFNFDKDVRLFFFDQLNHKLINKNEKEMKEIPIKGIINNFWEWKSAVVIKNEWFSDPYFLKENLELKLLLKTWRNNNFLIYKLVTHDFVLGLIIFGCDNKKILCNRENRLLDAIINQLGSKLSILQYQEELIKKNIESNLLLNLSENINKSQTFIELNENIYHIIANSIYSKIKIIITQTDKELNSYKVITDNSNSDLLLSNYIINDELFEEILKINLLLTNHPINVNNYPTLKINHNYYDDMDLLVFIEHKENNTIIFQFLLEYQCDINIEFISNLKEKLWSTIHNIFNLEKIKKMNNALIAQNKYLIENFEVLDKNYNIIGNSKSLKKIFHQINIISKNDANVLIWGETGTGKELIANAIHYNSEYGNKTMIKVNCASIPHNLLESELLGHEKGAFTGAFDRRIGKFELANNSTIFLNEIGELPIELQSKLLRVIQEKEFERIGSNKTIKVKLRIITATNRILDDEVKKVILEVIYIIDLMFFQFLYHH
jgi:formate hydrogenlyase transcriptional activator